MTHALDRPLSQIRQTRQIRPSRRIAPFAESVWLVIDGLSAQRPDAIYYGSGAPARELIPVDRLREASAAAWGDGAGALGYGETDGYAPLRELIAARMAALGTPADPAEILVVNGSQEGMDVVARALLEPGDIVLVEGPTFPEAVRLFASYEAEVVGMPMDAEGIVVDELPALLDALLQPPKFIYAIPTFQNPTGVTMPAARRQALADLARDRGILLVEDDPYSAFRYDGEDVPPLRAYAPDSVYLGTFSKTLAPALRVGWIAAPRPLYDHLFAVKECLNISNDRVMMRTVHRAADGFLDDHIAQVRDAYRSRRDALLGAMEEYLPPRATWVRPEGGFFVWIDLEDGADTDALLERAAAAGVIYLPGSWFFPGRTKKNGLRLSFSALPEEKLIEGMRRLGQVLATG